MTYRLGINTGFAVNRFPEPEEWTRVLKNVGVKYAQFTADLLNVSLPDKIVSQQIKRIKKSCNDNDIKIKSCFTGAFTRVNHLAHPDKEIRDYWVEWFKRFIDLSSEIGSEAIGSHFGIFSAKDDNDKNLRSERRAQNIAGWHEIGKYAKQKGLKYIMWEPMSISREQGETLSECRKLQDDVNKGAPIPFKICLDVDHGDLSSPNPDDIDPYKWLEYFAKESPAIHLKQSSANKGGHWPFTKTHNENGKITHKKVIESLKKQNIDDIDLVLELSFRERQPADSSVEQVLKESVDYWREEIKE